MTALRVIVEEMLAPHSRSLRRYAGELTRALLQTAPAGVEVEGFVAASPERDYARILEALPGLAALHKSALARRELAAAWQAGLGRVSGMVHAPSLLAPLHRHDRLHHGDQVIVTVHDVLAWTHPESLGRLTVAWHKAMLKRAVRHADAVVTPSHAVAGQLAELEPVLAGRIRVISGAGSSELVLPPDAAGRAAALELPERFVLAIGGIQPHRGIDRLLQAMPGVPAPLLLVGPSEQELAAAEAGLPPSGVRTLGPLDDADLAVVLQRASVFAYPNIEEGSGMPVLEAFALGTPVVHSDAPALTELSAGAGLAVPREGGDYPERLAEALRSVLDDEALAERMRVSGLDRVQVFDWRSAGEQVWALHADL